MKGGRGVFSAFMAIAITMGYLWYTDRPVSPREATLEDVMAEAKRGGYRIINGEELWGRYKEDLKKLLLVDTRQDWEYRTGHIQGALSFSMEPTWWSRWRKQGALDTFLGAYKDRFIVFY